MYTGTVILSTGAGKTRVGILAIEELIEKMSIKSCLIVVPTINLRDNEWESEIEK